MIKYRPEIDGLRAVAVIPVILFHLGFEWINGGYYGVDVFFVISGFLITSIILKELNKGVFSMLNFWKRRIRRILPLLLTVIITVLAFSFFMVFRPSLVTYANDALAATFSYANISLFLKFSDYWGSAAESSPFLHTWSLAVEEQFYLFWPFLVIYFFKKKIENFGFKLVLFVIINIIAVYILFDIDIANGLVYRSTLIRVLTLGLGGLIAFKENKIKDIKINKYLAVFIFIFCYFFGALGKYNPLSDFMPSSVIKLFCFGIVAIIFFLWVLKLNDKKTGLFYNFFASSFLAKAGLISYGLYLYHYPILYYFGYDPKSFTGSINIKEAILLISLIISISIFSYNLIEKPILKFKDKLK